MDLLIRQALGLDAATPWPPDFRTLLGLADGPLSPAAIESAVLERMEGLRAYQLVRPDAVTEVMNLLAQALVALSESPSRPGEPGLPLDAEAARPIHELAIERRTAEPLAAPRRAKHPPRRRDRPALVIPALPRFRATTPRRSRERMHRLAAVRRLLRDWDVAGDFLTSTRERGRAERVAVLAALWRIAVTADDWLTDDGPGGTVLGLARGPATLAALGDLSDARRELLADDWRAGRRVLFDESQRARSSVGRRGGIHAVRRWWVRSRRRVPVAILIACIVLAIPTLLVRFMTG